VTELIEGWKCEIVAGGYRRASWAGVVVMVMADGRLSAERANVPALVLCWLVKPLLDEAARQTVAIIRNHLNEHGFGIPELCEPKAEGK